jgi:phage shock protein B
MDENMVPVVAIVVLFIGFPWLILHYLTQWKRNKGLSVEDETLLDDMHETARRLDARLDSIERIMTADHPGWKDGR